MNEDGELQRVKTEAGHRIIPVHQTLIDTGFLDYLNERKQAGYKQLFDYRACGQNEDWSRQYCQQLGRMLTRLGMPPKNRPTAYSFRHTFVDELKQHEVDESIVSELVGHQNQSLTFGHYGKKYQMNLLKKHLDILTFVNE